ncbi:cobalamin B12-binding domain-containing protein [Paracraurococcus ruber]|uniref:B12-binding domain-containing protein n=1 Tax=Paracraurococcus ruber TaxID=77675 RepID=A0ABS1CVA1_9PROT|nr:cobalamin-dependent protein [Paracraurococcus ruber]MBK1657887.1 hypothetical protein [Paracraurococcus ruber]TDG32443.1 cobalamin-binding protein [Paracraurococcus ruber]
MVALGHSAAVRDRAEDSSLSAGGFAEAQAMLDFSLLPRRDSGHAALAAAIEAAVLPRLAMAHGAGTAVAEMQSLPDAAPTTADIEALYLLLVVDDRAGADARVDAVSARGVARDHLFLDLFAPVARRLGQAWEDDACDFGAVTVGLLRLQQMVRARSPDFVPPVRPLSGPRRVLLALPPGEQHSFGIEMLAGFFRRAGWAVWDPAPRGRRELDLLLRREAFEVVGFSAGSSARLDGIADCIRSVRRSALNCGAGVMVGGPLFMARPDYVSLVGADATATDGRQAVLQAERLLSLLARRD